MYRVIFEHHPKKDQEEAFIKQWQIGSDIIQTYPGARGTKLFRDKNKPEIIYAMAEWESKEARDKAIEAVHAEREDNGYVLHGATQYVDSHETIVEGDCIAESNPPAKTILTPELKVLNFQESLDFYTKLAGFEILYERPEEDFAMLGMNGARLMIEGLTDKSRTWKVGNLERPFGRGMHFQIEIPDVKSLYENFKKANYPIFFEMEEKWYRKNDKEVGNNQFLVQDPDGYLLRFFQDLGIRLIK